MNGTNEQDNYMKDHYAFPNIIQSILLVLGWLFILYPVTKLPFSFIENESLVSLLSGVLQLFLLLAFVRFLIKTGYVDQSQFRIGGLNAYLLLLICLVIACINFLPGPFLTYFDDNAIRKILIEPMADQVNYYYFIFSCILAPIFEEILFRGIIFNGLIRRHSFVAALLISSILFGLLHVSIISAFLFSCFAGWIYYRSNNLLYCIVAHAAGNIVGFFFQYVFVRNQVSMDAFSAYTEQNALFIGVSSILVSGLCLYVMALLFKKARLKNVVVTV